MVVPVVAYDDQRRLFFVNIQVDVDAARGELLLETFSRGEGFFALLGDNLGALGFRELG